MMTALSTAVATTLLAVVVQDPTALRAGPSTTAAPHAQLSQGDLLEVRQQRLDHLQVYNHRRERAGYVRASQVRVLNVSEAKAPELLTVLRFVRETPGAEALGIAYAAAYLKAAPAAQITAEPFDALGVLAERLARRAATSSPSNTVTSHMEGVAQYGVKFYSYENNNTLRLCYDGEAFRRVLAMSTPRATPEQQARAVLALTRHDCIDPMLTPQARHAHNQARAGLLDRLTPETLSGLDEMTRNRLRLRRAGVWAALAFGQSRRGEAPQQAAQRALDELAAVNKTELGDDETADYTEAAVRVGAVRWAAAPTLGSPRPPQLQLRPGEPGQTCVQLIGKPQPPTERCTYATVWAASAQPSADGRAITLAVQPMEGWTELWVWRLRPEGWVLDVLPPASSSLGLGYVEFAGWVPGTTPRLLVAREAKVEGRSTRRFEVLNLDTLTAERYAGTPEVLAAFGRWADAQWRRTTVSVR